jgi:hypothetical protein
MFRQLAIRAAFASRARLICSARHALPTLRLSVAQSKLRFAAPANGIRAFSTSAPSDQSVAEFLCLAAPAKAAVGERCVELIHLSMRDWPLFAENAKSIWGNGDPKAVMTLGTAEGLEAFCAANKVCAEYFNLNAQTDSPLYARRTLGALRVMHAMMDGMPKTIDAVAQATGHPDPEKWTREEMQQISAVSTKLFLEQAPTKENVAFIAAFGLAGCDVSGALRTSLQAAFESLCVNIRANFVDAKEGTQ